MNKTISIILFIVLAAAVVGAAMWYNNRSDETMQQAQIAASVVAGQAQSDIMQKFKVNDVAVGTGAEAKTGDTVSVLYTGSLDNGTVFDASSKHGNQPFSFTIGIGDVIKGWDLGVVGMKVGGTRELTIPPELGYGADGYPPTIPANATLHFTIQLLSIATSTQ